MSEVGKMCPVMSVGRFDRAACAGEHCAWWDRLCGACCMETVAGGIRDVGNHINALNIILEKAQGQAAE